MALVALFVLGGVALVGAALLLAVRSKDAYDRSNQLVPGRPSLAPGSWAGSHEPAPRLHRRLRDALAALRANQAFDDDGALLDLRVELEHQAELIDERLVAADALAPEVRDRPLEDLAGDVALLEQAVADLVALSASAGRPALEEVVARVTERVELVGEAHRSLSEQRLTLDPSSASGEDPVAEAEASGSEGPTEAPGPEGREPGTATGDVAPG